MILQIIFVGAILSAPLLSDSFATQGNASTYPERSNTKLASGEFYYSDHFTAAHKDLSFNTLIRITNPKNKKSVAVRINDRPLSAESDLVVTKAVSRALDIQGTTPIEFEILGIARSGDNPGSHRILEYVRIDKNTSNPAPSKINISDSLQGPTNLSSILNNGFTANDSIRFLDLTRKKVSPRGFGVQIGAFMNDENAFKYGEWASKKGYSQIYIENSKFGGNGFNIYRVIVGDFKSEEEADSRISEFSRAGFQSAVIYSFREE